MFPSHYFFAFLKHFNSYLYLFTLFFQSFSKDAFEIGKAFVEVNVDSVKD